MFVHLLLLLISVFCAVFLTFNKDGNLIGYEQPQVGYVHLLSHNTAASLRPRSDLLNDANNNRQKQNTITRTTNEPYRVVIFVDSKLLNVLLNWIIFYLQACSTNLQNLEIVSMDSNASILLHELGLPVSKYSFSLETLSKGSKYSKLSIIWLKRMEILEKLISSGMNVIFTDSDAIWIHDPLPALYYYSQIADVVASRAWYPQNVYGKWGASLCTGFMFIRASPFGQLYVSAISSYLSTKVGQNGTRLDDQEAANEVLNMWNISWPHRLTVDTNNVSDYGIVRVHDVQYNIALLPHSLFIRKCHKMKAEQILDSIDHAIIVHCLLRVGNGRDKESRLAGLSLWKLRKKWKELLQGMTSKHGRLDIRQGLAIISDDTVGINGTSFIPIPRRDRVKRLETAMIRANGQDRERIFNSLKSFQ